MSKDYYQTLGIERQASKEEIKKAFKKLALKYHPDRAPESKKKEYEDKFKEINEAVSILGDDKKRQQYDQYGSSAFSGSMGSEGYEGFDFSDVMSQFRSGAFGDFDDIFDQVFGGRKSRRHGRRGSDLAVELEVTLEEVKQGIKKEVLLNKLASCPDCKGKGAKKFARCSSCQGSGYLRRTQRTPFGIFQQTGPCSSCQGRGEQPQDTCSECGGEGLVRVKKKLEVNIPAGVENNMRLRVAGEGEAGDGQTGDLYLLVRVKEHAIFERQENDIFLTVPISFTQAVLGDEIEVPVLGGKAQLKIPSGTDSETVFRMKGKGLPSLEHSEYGDQLVKVQIQVPHKLDKRQKELILQLKEEKPSKSFLDKIFSTFNLFN